MAKSPERLAVKVLLPPCRMSFPWLFKPQDTDGGPRYQLNMLFPPKTDFKKFEDALYDCMEDMFGKDAKKWPRGRNDRGPDEVVRDATEKDYEGYKEGWKFVKAASKDPVGIVDARRDPVTNEREVYGGRWCRASVTVVAYDNKSKGVGVYLNSIQLLDHDEQFGGRGPAKNDFEDWDGDPLSSDDRGTGTGTSVSSSRGAGYEDRDADDDKKYGRYEGRDAYDGNGDRKSRPEAERRERQSNRVAGRDNGEIDGRSSRDRDRQDTRDRDRDEPRGRDRDDDRSARRSRDEDPDERPSRSRAADPEDVRPSRPRRDEPDERPSRRASRDEDWN